MKKIISKTNFSLLIIALCVILFCGLFAINNITTKKVSTAHAESSATLKGATTSESDHTAGNIWWTLLDYDIENLIITNTFDPSTAMGDPVDVSEEQNQSLFAYKIDNGNETFDCVIYADVDTIYAPENSKRLFSGYTGSSSSGNLVLENLKSITFENNCFVTSNAKYMQYMFGDCNKLTAIDVSNFNTSQVTNMSNMFGGCDELNTINLSNFDTSSVTNMSHMFEGCLKLIEIDLSNFDTSNVTDMSSMFYGCIEISNINISSKMISTDVYSWNTSQVTSMASMFQSCLKLKKLQLGHFNTQKVENFQFAFSGCRSLFLLDISNFSFDSIENLGALLCFFGVEDDFVVQQYGIKLEENQTFDEYLEQFLSSGNSSDVLKYMAYSGVRSSIISELHVPKNLNNYNLYIAKTTPMLYINGNETQPLSTETDPTTGLESYVISDSEQGAVLKTLNENTPSTGFVDEQLLPAIAIAFASIVAFIVTINLSKKKKNLI